MVLAHDVHERVRSRLTVQFAQRTEPYRLFFLENALSPENIDYFNQIRAHCTAPRAEPGWAVSSNKRES